MRSILFGPGSPRIGIEYYSVAFLQIIRQIPAVETPGSCIWARPMPRRKPRAPSALPIGHRRSRRTLQLLTYLAPSAVLLVSFLPGVARAETRVPITAALKRVHELRASRMGVDRHGNLWAWNRITGKTQWVDAVGEVRAGPTVTDASSVDMDSEWGALGLLRAGTAVVRVPANGGATKAIPLHNQASDVCWVGPDLAAVSPKFADRRVELLDLRTGLILSTIGDEAPVKPHVGAVLARTVILHFDFARQRLATLEAFSGDFRVFSPSGEPLYRCTLPVPNSERQSILTWLQQRDREARSTGDIQTPSVRYFSDFTLDRDGTGWAVGARTKSGDGSTFLAIRDTGVVERIPVTNANCAAPQLTSWGGWLIQYRDVASPAPPCVEERGRP
jgi:hypothetical protein